MIQYFHNRFAQYNKYTVAIEIPLKSDLLDLFSFGPKTIKIPVGVAHLHPADQYCKATGREVSKSKMKSLTYTLDSAEFMDEETIHLYLSATLEDPMILFRVHRKSEKVYLLSALQ